MCCSSPRIRSTVCGPRPAVGGSRSGPSGIACPALATSRAASARCRAPRPPEAGTYSLQSPPSRGELIMQFGFTLKPEHSIEATLDLARLGEDVGFDYLWLFDSHVLWREPYALLALIAEHTQKLRLGTCVTNPGTREPSVTASALATLDELSGGRMDLGIGRGDSARRVLGKPPITLA